MHSDVFSAVEAGNKMKEKPYPADCISTLDQLKRHIELSPVAERQLQRVLQAHPMLITPHYASLIDWSDPDDPIRKMAVPSRQELNLEGIYDTSGEAENTKLPGIQHKYAETALLLATNVCAMYCRHCFRKRLVGLPTKETLKRLEDAADYIKRHAEINNVLVSGGDPLTLGNRTIARMLSLLVQIPHVKFIRIGSRLPVTYPQRFDDEELLDVFRRYSHSEKRLYVVTQFNHPKEICPASVKAVSRLISAGVLVNNQAVLLKGVNNKPETLAALMNNLVGIGVTPYYVFQCRPLVRVKSHFQVPLCEGLEVVEKAKNHCSGLSKRFRYIMSHVSGKIEILGVMDGEMYFKYHQAKDRRNLGLMFKHPINRAAGWLDDFNPYEDQAGKERIKRVLNWEIQEGTSE